MTLAILNVISKIYVVHKWFEHWSFDKLLWHIICAFMLYDVQAGLCVKGVPLFWIPGARGNLALSDPSTPDQHQASQTHPPFPVGPQVSISQLLSIRLHKGWFNHVKNQINNNEFNPINSNREKMVINISMGSCLTTLFIKYHQEKMCLQNFFFLQKTLVLIIWNHVFFFFFLRPTTTMLLVAM